jgi:hypothetical protein
MWQGILDRRQPWSADRLVVLGGLERSRLSDDPSMATTAMFRRSTSIQMRQPF